MRTHLTLLCSNLFLQLRHAFIHTRRNVRKTYTQIRLTCLRPNRPLGCTILDVLVRLFDTLHNVLLQRKESPFKLLLQLEKAIFRLYFQLTESIFFQHLCTHSCFRKCPFIQLTQFNCRNFKKRLAFPLRFFQPCLQHR